MLNICSKWKLKQDTLKGGEFDVIFEAAKSPMLSENVESFWFGVSFLGVEGKLLKHPYFVKHISCLPVNPSNLEIKEQRFYSSRE